MKRTKFFLLTLALAFVLATAFGCAEKEEKTFTVGFDADFPPYGYIDENGVPRLNVLDLHKAIRSLPKPVIAMVNGYAIGGGHVLHIVCDLTIASENARF